MFYTRFTFVKNDFEDVINNLSVQKSFKVRITAPTRECVKDVFHLTRSMKGAVML